jgi:DNA polymerase III alpha subunit
VRTPDCYNSPDDYIKRTKELGHTHVFTTNHGISSEPYSFYEKAKKEGLQLVYGMEMYYVDDRFSENKSRGNHLIVVGLTKNAFYEINRISSEANKTGFYYNPRIDLELLLSLPANEVVITTACVNNRIFMGEDDWATKFLIPLKNHFKDNFMLEVQNHNENIQKEWNAKILEIASKYNIGLIHGNDSHYIYPEDAEKRQMFLKGKGLNYEYEDEFILDYPSYKTIVERYKKQGILSNDQIEESLRNTLIFKKTEDLGFTRDVKMPTIYPGLTVDERFGKLREIVTNNLKKRLKDEISKDRWQEYIDAVKFEMGIIKKTNIPEIRTADYFLLNNAIVEKAVNEYGGVLTKTGRGSAPSFYVNNLLGFTNIDRVDAPIPLYPTRFMSTGRVIASKSLPDIDFNTADPKPFIKASRDILGKDGSYYMIAFGTLKASGAFRLMCRAHDIEMSDYNEFAKHVGEADAMTDKEDKKKEFEKLIKDDRFGSILKESLSYLGVIDSASPHPCAHLVLNNNISTEIGLTRIGDELCASIDGLTAEVYGFLKNDWLVVTVWDIIDKVCKKVGMEVPSIKKLNSMLDEKTFKLYEDGITRTLNQADSDFAMPLFKKYKPKNVAEMSAMVAAIRPGFSSLLNNFLQRKFYSTGTPEVDNLLENSYHYLLYQENIMAFLIWLGIPEDETYTIIKKISKKKFKEKELDELESKLRSNWIKHIGNDDNFAQVWQVVNDASRYSFNASHSLSYAYDSLYGAYLKAHYPLQYNSIVLDMYKSDTDKTAHLIDELPYFDINLNNIEFRYSNSSYQDNKKTNSIYKSVTSLKYLNDKVSEELYHLRDNKYNNFIELLVDINNTSLNSRQLDILIKLGFFEEFGKSAKLLKIVDIYNKLYNVKQIKKDKMNELGVNHSLMSKYSNKETEKLFKEIDNIGLVEELTKDIEDEPILLKDRLQAEIDYMGYISYTNDNIAYGIYYVSEFKTYSDKAQPYFSIYELRTGKTIKTQIKDRKLFSSKPFKEGNILKIDYANGFKNVPKYKLGDNGKWVKDGDKTKQVVVKYKIYN